MRRIWAIMSAVGIIVFGGALTAAYPAAAATTVRFAPPGPPSGWASPGRPGGLMTAPQSRSVNRQQTTVSSSNWAGYAATSTTTLYNRVAASWVQPAARCGRGGEQYSAFWVGLDGYASPTVEQTGSEVDCIGRTAVYSAWYEMYPANPVYFANRVKAGDHFSASVTYTGANVFEIVLADSTQGWTHTIAATLAGAARSSAEVIAEAPCCTAYGSPLPLTNFGTVNFTGATANGAGLCAPGPVEIVMPRTATSAITGCENFSVSYGQRGNPYPWPYF